MLDVYSVVCARLLDLAFLEMFQINTVFEACAQQIYWEIAFFKVVG